MAIRINDSFIPFDSLIIFIPFASIIISIPFDSIIIYIPFDSIIIFIPFDSIIIFIPFDSIIIFIPFDSIIIFYKYHSKCNDFDVCFGYQIKNLVIIINLARCFTKQLYILTIFILTYSMSMQNP